MSTVMLGALIEQIVLISQNATSQELHTATKRGWLRFRYANAVQRSGLNIIIQVKGKRNFLFQIIMNNSYDISDIDINQDSEKEHHACCLL